MDYPFIKCLHPRYITNPYTGERLLTDCRDCDACINRVGNTWSQLCNVMSEDHRYTVFLTLTYANEKIPTCSPVRFHGKTFFKVDNRKDFKDSPYIDPKYGYVLTKKQELFWNSHYNDPVKLSEFIKKCNLPNGKIPILAKSHLQKFFKRFRYYLKKYGIYEKIEHYSIGEIGPEHFRSHFHSLLYFDDPNINKVLRQAIYKAWTNGYIYIEYTTTASKYLSAYLNKPSSFPSLFQTPSFKPFRLHSTFFAASQYKKMAQSLYEYDNRKLITRIVRIHDKEQRLSMWRNVTNLLYPKVRGFNRADDNTLFRLYTCYKPALFFVRQHNRERRIKDLTLNEIAKTLCELQPKYFDFLTYDFDKREFRKPENVYRDLYISKYFLTKILPNGDIKYSCAYIRKFQKFYSDLELCRLKTFYESQENNPKMDFRFYYDNYSASHPIYKNPLYRSYFSQQSSIAINSVKHKRLNDLNQIFNYG